MRKFKAKFRAIDLMPYMPCTDLNYASASPSARLSEDAAIAFLKAYKDIQDLDAAPEARKCYDALVKAKGLSCLDPFKEIPLELWDRPSFGVTASSVHLTGLMSFVHCIWVKKLTAIGVVDLDEGLVSEWLSCCKEAKELRYDNNAANKLGWDLFKENPALTGLSPWVRRYAAMLLFKNTWEALGVCSDALVKRAQDVKGWRQAHELLSPEINWTTFLAKDKASLLTEDQLAQAQCPLGLKNVHPYKKGFDVSEYEYLCKHLKLEPFTFKKDKANGAYQACAARLVLLFGKDTVKIEQFVYIQTGKAVINLKTIHDAGQIVITNKKAFNREFWGSFIFKSPRLAQYTQYFSDYEAKFELPSSVDEFFQKVPHFIYEGVTPKYEKLAGYMWQYGYSSEEFSDLMSFKLVPKQESLIPRIDEEIKDSDYCVRSALFGDSRLLVAGHLSGCCQSVFRDGHECALHSYEKSSSEVIWVEHKKSGKILAQMWLWLSASKRVVVIDSVESLIRDDATVVEICESAVKLLKTHFKKNSMNLYLSDNYFGITAEVALKFKNNPRVNTPKMLEPCDYIDAGSVCFKLQ